MAVDTQTQAVLDQMAQAGGLDFASMTPQQAREAAAARMVPVPAEPVHRREDRTVPGPAGDIPVRVYSRAGSGPFACFVYFHGGGWVLGGGLDNHDALCSAITNRATCVTVSVDYRLAPEAKFPSPAEECYAVTRWVADHAGEFNVDPRRIAVGGDSAGGNLAAAVALMARDRGAPSICFQLLAYPCLDRRFDTASYVDNGKDYLLTKDAMVWFWDHYLSSDADADNPYACPLRSADLSGLPPALVMTAEYDPLRDEGEAYARALSDAGVKADLKRYEGAIHGFLSMFTVLDIGMVAVREASMKLREAFMAAMGSQAKVGLG